MWGSAATYRLKSGGQSMAPKGRNLPTSSSSSSLLGNKESLIDTTDFSDHFVVRRQLPDNIGNHGGSTQISSTSRRGIDKKIDGSEVVERPESFKSELTEDRESPRNNTDDHIYPARRVPSTFDLQQQWGQGKADRASTPLVPFQFGKRPKTPGYSPLLEGKRLHNDVQQTSPVFTSYRAHMSTFSDRPQFIGEPNITPASLPDLKFQQELAPELSKEDKSTTSDFFFQAKTYSNAELSEIDNCFAFPDSYQNLLGQECHPDSSQTPREASAVGRSEELFLHDMDYRSELQNLSNDLYSKHLDFIKPSNLHSQPGGTSHGYYSGNKFTSSNLQSKPNVYRNSSYSPSNYYPLVPTPPTDNINYLNLGSASGACGNYLNNTKYSAVIQNSAKGDAPPATAGEIPGDLIPSSPTTPTPRPKTVIGDTFLDSSSVTNVSRNNNSLLLPRPPKAGLFYPTLTEYKKKSNISSINNSNSSIINNFKSGISGRVSKQDLSSPLSSFHAPIRPYLRLSDDNNNNNTSKNYHSNSFLTDASPWKHSIFTTCGQKSPIPMCLVFEYLVNIRKVGEGVYGEVYKAFFKGLTEQRVYKVVPIEGAKIVNGEKQKKFGEIEPEIIVSQELNKLREGYNGCYTDGHAKLLFTRITQGKYPSILVQQWKSWHRTYVSQNDLPEFTLSQLYAIFEFEYHGTDIESYKFRNAKQSLAVLLHVVHALGAAEAALEFEHRDLHWGNILVLKTRELYSTYSIQGTTFRVPNVGLKSTIIDYTISRLTSASGEPIFTDLANDEDQFCGSEDYQFEIYRMMREENQNDWKKFCPKTNIFWCHYLVGKLIEKGRYCDTISATHLRFKNKLFRIQSNILKYSSCMECARRYLPSYCRDIETD